MERLRKVKRRINEWQESRRRARKLHRHAKNHNIGKVRKRSGRTIQVQNRKLDDLQDRRKRLATRDDHEVIPRSEWHARAPKSRSSMSSTSNGVFIHHTVGAEPSNRDAEKAEMRAIQRFHQDSRGWADIGYSFVVFPSGRIYEGRGKNVAGAHTAGHNSTSYGLCAAGNYESSEPSAALIASLRWLRRDYLGLGDAPLRPHSAVYPTACPGKNLRSKLDQL